MGPTSGLKVGFLPFSQIWLFGSLVFLEIAYSGSLQQCLTSSREKAHEKNVGFSNLGQTSQNWA